MNSVRFPLASKGGGHSRSQDFPRGMHSIFFPRKLMTFLVVVLNMETNLLNQPLTTPTLCTLTTYPSKLSPFFVLALGVRVHPVQPWLYACCGAQKHKVTVLW